MHWHLDVIFREDSNKTIEETANKNMNIIRKWALGILKILDTGKQMSMKLKRFTICTNPIKFISKIIEAKKDNNFTYVFKSFHAFVLAYN